jgi:hypothetical protein
MTEETETVYEMLDTSTDTIPRWLISLNLVTVKASDLIYSTFLLRKNCTKNRKDNKQIRKARRNAPE